MIAANTGFTYSGQLFAYELSLFILDWSVEGTLWRYLAVTALGFLMLLFLLLNKWSKHSNFAVTIFFEIEPEFLAESKLEQIIVKRLFWNFDFLSGIFKWPTLKLDLVSFLVWYHDTIVELSPSAYLLNDLGNGSLLGSLLALIGIRNRATFDVHFILLLLCGSTLLGWLSFYSTIPRLHDVSSVFGSSISALISWARRTVVLLIIISVINLILFKWFFSYWLCLSFFTLSHIVRCFSLLNVFWSLFILFI